MEGNYSSTNGCACNFLQTQLRAAPYLGMSFSMLDIFECSAL